MCNRGASRAWFRPIAVKEGTGAVRIEKRGRVALLILDRRRKVMRSRERCWRAWATRWQRSKKITNCEPRSSGALRPRALHWRKHLSLDQNARGRFRTAVDPPRTFAIRLARATVDPFDRRDHGALNWLLVMCASPRRT
jgi:hypothetical protein